MESFKESRVAAEANKFAIEMAEKLEKERNVELTTIVSLAKKSPIVITVLGENPSIKNDYILYDHHGKLEVATPDKMKPAFKSLEELGEYISKLQNNK